MSSYFVLLIMRLLSVKFIKYSIFTHRGISRAFFRWTLLFMLLKYTQKKIKFLLYFFQFSIIINYSPTLKESHAVLAFFSLCPISGIIYLNMKVLRPFAYNYVFFKRFQKQTYFNQVFTT